MDVHIDVRRITAAGCRHVTGLLGIGLLIATGMMGQEAWAQRPFPFRVYDPFYHGETARRTFHDGFAATGALAWHGAEKTQDGEPEGTQHGPYDLSLRLDYQLAQRLDLSAFWEAAGADSKALISWIGLKYYWTVENADYAFRLAVDPDADGRLGFPQIDLAFLATRGLSPVLSSDIALGVRRVCMGYQQSLSAGQDMAGPAEYLDMRALGLELHFMWTYSVIFDPARSNVFLSIAIEGGQYTLFEASGEQRVRAVREEKTLQAARQDAVDHYRGGVVWIRSGVKYNRPRYQLNPFFGVPLKHWAAHRTGRPRMPQVQFGVRLMLR